MCGILATFHTQNTRAIRDVARGVSALHHRGPDGTGLWESPDGRVTLAHTRLAVVAPHTSSQPVHNEAHDVHAVCNGEIYDAAERRRDLRSRGHRLEGQGDSELLVHLYEEHGDDVVHTLRGEFAFCLFDQRRSRLVVARDRFGTRPVVYHHHDGLLTVASEAKALFAMGIRPRWDRASVLQGLSMQYPSPRRTLFDGVAQLPAGHMLVADERGIRIHRWATPLPPERPAPDSILSALDVAVRRRLVADVPVAFHLSGGLDSTAVLALARRYLEPTAFTVRFGEGSWSEVDHARASAEALGTRLCVVDADPDRAVEALPAAVSQGEGLAINGHIAAKNLLARAVRDAGFRVVLTGEGADELFGGYAHLERDAGVHTIPPLAAAGTHIAEGDGLPLPQVHRRLGFLPTFLVAKASIGARIAALLRDHVRDEVADGAHLAAAVSDCRIDDHDRVAASTALWNQLCLSGYILRTLADAQEMAHGIEGRLPFLDPDVARCAAGLSTPDKFARGQTKFALRRALAGVVPDAALARPKHPFMAPPLVAARPGWFRDLFASEAARSQPFVDPDRMLRRIDSLGGESVRQQVAAEPALMIGASLVLLQHAYRPEGP